MNEDALAAEQQKSAAKHADDKLRGEEFINSRCLETALR